MQVRRFVWLFSLLFIVSLVGAERFHETARRNVRRAHEERHALRQKTREAPMVVTQPLVQKKVYVYAPVSRQEIKPPNSEMQSGPTGDQAFDELWEEIGRFHEKVRRDIEREHEEIEAQHEKMNALCAQLVPQQSRIITVTAPQKTPQEPPPVRKGKRPMTWHEFLTVLGVTLVLLALVGVYSKIRYGRWMLRSWYGEWYFRRKEWNSSRKAKLLKELKRRYEDGNNYSAYVRNRLGVAYLQGYGVKKDYERALFWLVRAAYLGSVEAQMNIGMMYEDGLGGVERNPSLAFEWYSCAAENGFAPAQKALDELMKSRGKHF